MAVSAHTAHCGSPRAVLSTRGFDFFGSMKMHLSRLSLESERDGSSLRRLHIPVAAYSSELFKNNPINPYTVWFVRYSGFVQIAD